MEKAGLEPFRIFNYLSRKKEIFRPIRKNRVGLYTCGPTVYNYAHIGNLRTYIFNDVLQRTLEYAGYKVKRVMNITDVGHLTDDADAGEDKLEKEAVKERKSPWDIARFYTEAFLSDLDALNIKKPKIIVPATSTINEQISIIKILKKKGFAYETESAVYFEVSKFKNYGKFSGQTLSEKMIAARDEVVEDPKKKHPADFALWFKLAGRHKQHIMRWPSPWGEGFPGWHIECSAISVKYLGQPFDIHTGGVDHIGTHHSNEIAQSEGAAGKRFVNYFAEAEHLLADNRKMSKSLGNFYTLRDIKDKEFNPVAFRYLCLTAHYRSRLNFTWNALSAAQNGLNNIYEFWTNVSDQALSQNKKTGRSKTDIYKKRFRKPLFDDLNTPAALAVLWKIKEEYYKNPGAFNPKEVVELLKDFDKVLGFGLKKPEKIPENIRKLSEERTRMRKEKKWDESDRVRKEMEKLGWMAEDTPAGTNLRKKSG